ncbi:Schizosaccharomyces specific protein [Schizosaccharomyces pombe]|uniref:Uncharacterized membrane protein C18E5.14c n=1 Tax=Schizosaccharomyces pombe (strain 972 / ATCC 24843) TaxID=284812 RepID=YBSE_SCHPO|nr:uncharacterized protein SPBC18E5.14c [Schizosaccharomyces pombe]Q9C0X1.3 RecName: Full=Uncharacterized membrane protein C18E5.14c [Schizosaccharomyces pombe 972h-]CAC34982.3 sequence orphan [Schizosaccharomyces pombe]|eukprot:NP_595855.3 uncharacterized protein SPBC18E5.14c [Schizosaccharomyces pombe]
MISLTALDLLDELLNDSSSNMIWLYEVYMLYKTYTSYFFMSSKSFVRGVKRYLIYFCYCANFIALFRVIFGTIFVYSPDGITPFMTDFVRWILIYLKGSINSLLYMASFTKQISLLRGWRTEHAELS